MVETETLRQIGYQIFGYDLNNPPNPLQLFPLNDDRTSKEEEKQSVENPPSDHSSDTIGQPDVAS